MNLNALMPIKGYDLSGGWECWWGTNYSTAKEMNSAIEGSMAEFDTSVYDVLTGIQTAIDLLQEKIGELYEQLAAI